MTWYTDPKKKKLKAAGYAGIVLVKVKSDERTEEKGRLKYRAEVNEINDGQDQAAGCGHADVLQEHRERDRALQPAVVPARQLAVRHHQGG